MQSAFENAGWFWLLVLLAGVGLLAWMAEVMRRRREHAWKRVARHLRLNFSHSPSGSPELKGIINGVPVELRESPDHADTEAGVVVAEAIFQLRGVPEGMTARSAVGVIGELTNLAEGHLPLNDEEFDHNVHLVAQPSPAIFDYWTNERKSVFLALVEANRDDQVELSQNRLIAERRGIHNDVQEIERWLKTVSNSARLLSSPQQ